MVKVVAESKLLVIFRPFLKIAISIGTLFAQIAAGMVKVGAKVIAKVGVECTVKVAALSAVHPKISLAKNVVAKVPVQQLLQQLQLQL